MAGPVARPCRESMESVPDVYGAVWGAREWRRIDWVNSAECPRTVTALGSELYDQSGGATI